MRSPILFLLLLICIFSKGQNLVPNNSFETISAVPGSYGMITNATGWYSANGTCDLFHTSAGASVGIPANGFGNQTARTGSAYGGIAGSSTNVYHEYLAIPLSSALVPGTTYYCEAYVSPGEGIYMYGTNNFGFRFSTGAIFGAAGDPPIAGGTSVNWTPVLTNYSGWTQVSGTFVASAANTHLTLGNFFSTAATTWTNLGTGGSIGSQYWYVEDVVVQPSVILEMEDITWKARPVSATTVSLEWSLTDANDIREFTIQRSLDAGQNWEQISRIPADAITTSYSTLDKPQLWEQEIWYTLRKVASDGSVSYSEVSKVTLNYPGLEQSLVASPNPIPTSQNTEVIFAADETGEATWAVYDISGSLLFSGIVETEPGTVHFTLPTGDLKPGNYMMVLNVGVECSVRRLVVI